MFLMFFPDRVPGFNVENIYLSIVYNKDQYSVWGFNIYNQTYRQISLSFPIELLISDVRRPHYLFCEERDEDVKNVSES